MHSDWFNGIEILKGRRQHGEKVGYCYPRGLEKTLCEWDICPVGHERVGGMEKKWDTVIPADLKRLFVSGTYMSRWSRKGWQHGEKVGYCYPSGLEKTLCEWDIYVPLVTKGLNQLSFQNNGFSRI